MTDNSIYLIEPKTAGGIYRYPLGVSLTGINDATTPPPTGGVNLGYISEDGISLSIDGEPIETRDWAKKIRRSKKGEQTITISGAFLECTAEVFRTLFGDAAVTVNGGVVKVRPSGTPVSSGFLFDMEDEDRGSRIIVHSATPSVSGEITFVAGEAITWPFTLTVETTAAGDDIDVLFEKPETADDGE